MGLSRRVRCCFCALSASLLMAGPALASLIVDTVPIAGTPGGIEYVNYDYNMGKFEITTTQYAAFLNAVARDDTYGLYDPRMGNNNGPSGDRSLIQRDGIPGQYTYSAVSGRGTLPIATVSWVAAIRYCNWMTNGQPTGAQRLGTTESGAYLINGATSPDQLWYLNREAPAQGRNAYYLPTHYEWMKSAFLDPETGHFWRYATANNNRPGRDLSDIGGNDANYVPAFPPFDWPPDDASSYWLTDVGHFRNSPSAYGTFDQAGNVWELTEELDTHQPYTAGRGAFGGSFATDARSIDNFWSQSRYSSIFLQNIDPMAGSGDIGFRVVMVRGPGIPEPASIALAALGGAAVLIGRRRANRR